MPHRLLRSPLRALLRSATLLAAAAVLAGALAAETPNDVTVYVGSRDSGAFANAESMADGSSSFAERSFHRGLGKALEMLRRGDVTIKVAEGEYDGQLGMGVWVLDQIDAEDRTLRILGGYDASFSSRDPFGTPSVLVTAPGRSGPMLEFATRSKLKELVISGLVFDAGNSNVYDDGTNSIVRGSGTRTLPIINFKQIQLERLVVADNAFVNAAQVAFDPLIKPVGNSEFIITNNFFLNCIMPIQKLGADGISRAVGTLRFTHNTVLLNWPLNPDPTSSNVGSIGLVHSGYVSNLEIESNIFAYNVGGAFQHDWALDRMGRINFENNLFWENGLLFGEADAPIVGKFGPNPRYLVISLDDLEDELEYGGGGNVTMDPDIYIDINFFAEMEEEEDWAEIYVDSFAPRMEFYADSPPFPQNPDAEPYGVQRNQVWDD